MSDLREKLEASLAILPCPFCGGEADLYRPPVSKWWRVECDSCGCQTEPFHDDLAGAIAAWNTRAPVRAA